MILGPSDWGRALRRLTAINDELALTLSTKAVYKNIFFWHYPTLAPPGGLTLHIEKLLNSSFSINLLCLQDLAHFSYIYISYKRTVFKSIII